MTMTKTDDDFLQQADPYRGELLAHCYRMMGSVHEAEDLVQETFIRAWKAHDKFEGRSSLRTWLYRIATRVCLTALDGRDRRPLPTGLGGPTDAPEAPIVQHNEVPWLEPIPNSMLGGAANDPANIATSRESVRLAFIAALQHLPPKQRVVLLLRDVLKWRAAEVGEFLDTSVAAVNSLLQRARAQLDKVGPSEDNLTEPTDPDVRDLLERYVTTYEAYDIDGMLKLLTEDAEFEMPPYLEWAQGILDVGRLIKAQCPASAAGDLRMLVTFANGQPAAAMYLKDPADGIHYKFGIHVLDVVGSAITHVTSFFDTSLFAKFGLPDTIAG